MSGRAGRYVVEALKRGVATGIVTGLTIQCFNASNGLLKLSTSPG
jgi:hypothetical protein